VAREVETIPEDGTVRLKWVYSEKLFKCIITTNSGVGLCSELFMKREGKKNAFDVRCKWLVGVP